MSGEKCIDLNARRLMEAGQMIATLERAFGAREIAAPKGQQAVTVFNTSEINKALESMREERGEAVADSSQLMAQLQEQAHNYSDDLFVKGGAPIDRVVIDRSKQSKGVYSEKEDVLRRVYKEFTLPGLGNGCVTIYEDTYKDGSKSYVPGIDTSLLARDAKGEFMVSKESGDLVWKNKEQQDKWKKRFIEPVLAHQEKALAAAQRSPTLATDAAARHMKATLKRRQTTAAGTTQTQVQRAPAQQKTETAPLKTRTV
jgi:hypothetical protein